MCRSGRMADLFARIDLLLVVFVVALPAKYSDSLADGLAFVLVAYAVILALLVLLALSGSDVLFGTPDDSRTK